MHQRKLINSKLHTDGQQIFKGIQDLEQTQDGEHLDRKFKVQNIY